MLAPRARPAPRTQVGGRGAPLALPRQDGVGTTGVSTGNLKTNPLLTEPSHFTHLA